MAATPLLSSCSAYGVLDPKGPIASAERLILLNATSIMLVVAVPVIVMTFAFAWWYRASNSRAVYRPDWSFSGRIELVVWAIPAMVVMLLGGVGWLGAHDLDPGKKIESTVAPIRIQVVSLDWKWLFIYPDHQVAAINQLVVPAATPIEFALTSATVMNAFFVPQLGSQIYAMAGMTTRLHLLADRPGVYPGLSSHFSGDGFSDMHFLVHAVPANDFAAWVARTQTEGSALDTQAYAKLLIPSHNVKPQTYRSVSPMLLDHILQTAAPMSHPHHAARP